MTEPIVIQQGGSSPIVQQSSPVPVVMPRDGGAAVVVTQPTNTVVVAVVMPRDGGAAVVVTQPTNTVVVAVAKQGPPGPPGAAIKWWITEDETVNVAERGQYGVHGEFRCEGTINVGLNAELRVMA